MDRVGLALIAVGLVVFFGAPYVLSSVSTPQVVLYPVSIFTVYGSNGYTAQAATIISPPPGAPETVMVFLSLGPYTCTSGCTMVTPVTINWGDGSPPVTISNIQGDCLNVNTCDMYGPPGDGLGTGWQYTNYEAFYHTYAADGVYTVSASGFVGSTPMSFLPASITVGPPPASTTTTTSTASTSGASATSSASATTSTTTSTAASSTSSATTTTSSASPTPAPPSGSLPLSAVQVFGLALVAVGGFVTFRRRR